MYNNDLAIFIIKNDAQNDTQNDTQNDAHLHTIRIFVHRLVKSVTNLKKGETRH